MYYLYRVTVEDQPDAVYYGITKDYERRWKAHRSNFSQDTAKHKWLKAARRADKEIFFDLLGTFPTKQLAAQEETKLIQAAQADPAVTCYNMAASASDIPRLRTPEGRRRTGDANREHQSQVWKVWHPDGREEIIVNMKEFCVQKGLDPSTMTKVSRGQQPNHKGYICEKMVI